MSSESFVGIYNPLGSDLSAYENFRVWRSKWNRRTAFTPWGNDLIAGDAALVTRPLLRAYLPHIAGRLGQIEPSGFAVSSDIGEDKSELAAQTRAYFTEVIEHSDLPLEAMSAKLVFPDTRLFDARCIEVSGTPVIFLTSRVLELARCFGRTVSLCARLNDLAAPSVLETTDPDKLPPRVLLAWETIQGAGQLRVLIDSLLQLPPGREQKEGVLKMVFDQEWFRPEHRRGHARAMISFYLIQMMLQGVSNAIHGRAGVESVLDAATDPEIGGSPQTIDSEYLTLLILVFIVLHELGHLVLGHNRLQPLDNPQDAQLRRIAEAAKSWADAQGFQAWNLMDSILSYELAADKFALGVAGDTLQHPLLEAATLWCAALSAGNDTGEDWLEKSFKRAGDSHPDFAMRVHMLNGHFSTGDRAVWVAQQITKRAQSLADGSRADWDPAAVARLFCVLWEIGLDEVRAG
jgi:hypothetical protein